jgi:gliding motility-associated-like protein
VIVFKGAAIYVPTGFSPNHDGKNELLRPRFIGIKKIFNFSVYNRWGQMIFSTNRQDDGWDGTVNGKDQPVGTYVWTLKVEDVLGNIHEKKGTATLLR